MTPIIEGRENVKEGEESRSEIRDREVGGKNMKNMKNMKNSSNINGGVSDSHQQPSIHLSLNSKGSKNINFNVNFNVQTAEKLNSTDTNISFTGGSQNYLSRSHKNNELKGGLVTDLIPHPPYKDPEIVSPKTQQTLLPLKPEPFVLHTTYNAESNSRPTPTLLNNFMSNNVAEPADPNNQQLLKSGLLALRLFKN